MTDDDLPRDTGDHRPVNQRALREFARTTGKTMREELRPRDARIAQLETAVGLLTKALEAKSGKR